MLDLSALTDPIPLARRLIQRMPVCYEILLDPAASSSVGVAVQR